MMPRTFTSEGEQEAVAILQALEPSSDPDKLDAVRRCRRFMIAEQKRLQQVRNELSEKLSWQERVIRLCDYLLIEGGRIKLLR